MAYDLSEKLVVAVASSALFNLRDSDHVFQSKGESAYREYQRENEMNILETGVAYPLVKRLLDLNDSESQPIEVVLFSRNDPDTGLRVFNSIEHYGLNISRAVFVTGKNPKCSIDRKSTRLNSSHVAISYAVFCLKKKTNINQ